MKEQKAVLKAKQRELAERTIQYPAAGLSVFPNPTRRLTNIQLNLEKKGKVSKDLLASELLIINEKLTKKARQAHDALLDKVKIQARKLKSLYKQSSLTEILEEEKILTKLNRVI